MIGLINTLLFIVILVIIFRPKIGTSLIWLILFTYPHSYWYYKGALPLNIGVDDLICIFLFLWVLICRILLGPVKLRLGYAFWVITIFSVIGAVSNAVGMLDYPRFGTTVIIKDVLKNGVYWGLFFAILHSIDNEKDLRLQINMFAIAAIIGGVVVIAQVYFPYRFEIFAAPALMAAEGFTFESRAAGSFMNPNSAACVLGCSLLMVATNIKLQKSVILKIFSSLSLLVLLGAILLTQSRTGLLALVCTLFLMAILGKNKKIAWIGIISVIILIMSLPVTRSYIVERFSQIYDPMTGRFGENIEGRFRTWKNHFDYTTFKDYIFGQGPIAARIKTGTAETHSTYVSLITIYGLGAVVWAIASLFVFFKKLRFVKKQNFIVLSSIADGCFWALILWGIFAATADLISSAYARYLLFYLVVLIDRVYYFTQTEEQFLLSCEPGDYDYIPDAGYISENYE